MKTEKLQLYPMALKIGGRRCVVVGGGSIAERKVLSLVQCQARVVVVSPELTPTLEAMASAGEIEIERRRFDPADATGAVVIIAATDDRAVNESVKSAGNAAGALVNVVDVPDLCDFYVPASLRRGDLQITISTGGACPALAKHLRQELEAHIGPEYETYSGILAQLRLDLREAVSDPAKRKEAEEAYLASPALDHIRSGNTEEAVRLAKDCLAQYAD